LIPYNRPSIGEDEIAEVVDTLRSGWLTTGPKVARFEEAFRAYVGAPHAIGVSSCTAGLFLALAAAGIGPGDEVITTPFTFCATVNVIVQQGATPVLVDISPDDYNINPDLIEAWITPRTRAIIPVHYGGQPCRMDEILDIARRHQLLVIEDAAHAHGARYNGRLIGGFGDVAVFSFYATKNMTTGEGGMVTSHLEPLAERIRLLSNHGMDANAKHRYDARGSWYYEVLAPGYKYNLTDIQAALGLHQLRQLESFLARRTEIAARYSEAFSTIDRVLVPRARPEVRHTWHLYPIQVQTGGNASARDRFIARLRDRGIGTSVHFIPIHYHPYYREGFGFRKGDFPVCEAVYEGIISLPLYPRLTDEEVERVIDAVREAARQT
jgi:dTDP-4-amino-4,6-dideoxygalactose transaminase